MTRGYVEDSDGIVHIASLASHDAPKKYIAWCDFLEHLEAYYDGMGTTGDPLAASIHRRVWTDFELDRVTSCLLCLEHE